MKIKTNSSQETKIFAELLAEEFLKSKNFKKAAVLALQGNLGSGKTTFVQGFLKALGIKKNITSPTFVLLKSYKLQAANYKRAYHLDCYRIKKINELMYLGLKDILENKKNIILVEWPERIKKVLPKNSTIWLKFNHGKSFDERKINF